MAINKVEANGETLIDLTNDTATANDVIEGQTFHLRSGAIATGTYRPSDEIEARLEATVGHSSKNLLAITLESDTYTNGGANLTYTVDKAAGTITINGTSRTDDNDPITLHIFDDPTSSLNGKLYFSGGAEHCPIRAYDATTRAWAKAWNGVSTSPYSYSDSQSSEVAPVFGHQTEYRIRIPAKQTINNEVLKPMLRDGNISDDTFEPYVTPTDEKKQDKPVELDPTVLTWNIADIQSKYVYLQIVCECIDTAVTPNMGLYDVITIPTVIFGRVANADKIMAFTSTMTMSESDTVLFTESNGNVSAYIEPSVARGTRTIIQIIGIPK